MATFRELTTGKGERRWKAIVRRKGFPPRYATFTTKRDAERWALAFEGQVAQTRHLPMLEAERHTLADLLDRYEPELSEKRKKAVAAHLAWWRAAVGSKRLSDLTSALIREHRDRLQREPYTRSAERKSVTLTKRRKATNPRDLRRTPATVNRYVETLSKMLSVAVGQYEWMADNPCARIPDLKEPRGRVRFLSDDERAALLAACEAEGPDLYALVVTALCTGARAGELTGLRWPDVDLNRKRATLHKTKNDERRALSLTGPALAALQARSKVRRIDTDLVFPQPGPAAPGTEVKPYDYAKAFRDACATAGIKDFRFHDLRHSAASYLAMNGATIPELAAVLGHRTLQMVQRYSHLTDTHVSTVVERMTDKVFGPA
jgi:integrase